MFNFGKTKLPAGWPALHNKCNKSACTFANQPQPAPGTYNCRGCLKGTYTVSKAQAREADAASRTVFYVPGTGPALGARAHGWSLDQEFSQTPSHHKRVDSAPARPQRTDVAPPIATRSGRGVKARQPGLTIDPRLANLRAQAPPRPRQPVYQQSSSSRTQSSTMLPGSRQPVYQQGSSSYTQSSTMLPGVRAYHDHPRQGEAKHYRRAKPVDYRVVNA